MNDSKLNPVLRRRWLAWQPGESISANSAATEPTKPSEPGFDGFDGSAPAQLPVIEAPAREPQGLCASDPHRPKSVTSGVDSTAATERLMSWAEWKAGALNQLFLELGSTRQPGRITPETVRHSEQASMTNLKNRDVTSQKSPRSE